ncbi:biotin transporter BioY [Enterovirga sp. CN4-39]|uniref:biotin transporter BioY n=1 Tax=Enterovirga sp. CN4-39 TaxID=3400910 RepID=UPI003BFDFF2D
MPESASPVQSRQAGTAGLLWPAATGSAGLARGVLFAVGGACLLTLSAKMQVPGPVPMTLQTLAVMALGAALGMRLAIASVVLYLAQGAFGLPVFANTPPMVPGLAYFLGPTGGFLLGFVVAAGMVGYAADRGLMRRPIAFALALTAANVAMMAIGAAWIALIAQTSSGMGLGFAKAWALGVQPFMLGNAIKLAIAALAFPAIYQAFLRLARR